MGVFARLLRRSKATEEASTAEAQADTPTAEPAAEETEKATEVKESAEAEDATEAKAEVVTKAEDAAESAENNPVEADAGDGDGVEIPKQQSAEEAADSEAGEGART